MTGSVFDHRMRSVLAQLELISSGTTQSYNSGGGGGGGNPLGTPAGAAGAEHLKWSERYGPPFAADSKVSARDDIARSKVIADAKAELKQLRGHGIDRSRVVGETREQESTRILAEGEGFTAAEVALRFKCTPTRVRRLRLAVGRDPATGRQSSRTAEEEAAEAAAAAEAGAAAEAQRMQAKGLSQRQIALVLDRPRRTIRDWLEAA